MCDLNLCLLSSQVQGSQGSVILYHGFEQAMSSAFTEQCSKITVHIGLGFNVD